jgi:hypothetical protein
MHYKFKLSIHNKKSFKIVLNTTLQIQGTSLDRKSWKIIMNNPQLDQKKM